MQNPHDNGLSLFLMLFNKTLEKPSIDRDVIIQKDQELACALTGASVLRGCPSKVRLSNVRQRQII
jgi:hypothetical protein